MSRWQRKITQRVAFGGPLISCGADVGPEFQVACDATGFESLRLRHIAVQARSITSYFPCISAVLRASMFPLCFTPFSYIPMHLGAPVGALIRKSGGIDADRACHQECPTKG